MMDDRRRGDRPSHETGAGDDGRGHDVGHGEVWDGPGKLLAAGWRALTLLWRAGSRRQLALRKPSGEVIVRLPITLAVLIGLFLLWRALPLLIIVVVLVLALRGTIVVLRQETHQG